MTTTDLVPFTYPVGLNGLGYLLDDDDEGGLRHVTIPQIKPQADTDSETSEGSLNPEGLWRHTQHSWHLGAGQTYRDKPTSSEFMFRSSKGIDPWTRYQLGLLRDTDHKKTLTTGGQLVVAGSYLYLLDFSANALYRTQDITVDSPTWTAVTGLPAAVFDITTDGATVYVACGSDGIYTTTAGGASASSWVTGSVSTIAFVKDRLMASFGAALYNVTTAGALPAALLTADIDTIGGWAEGTNQIYVGGYRGDKSLIYRTAVKADGTALDVPVVAGQLPDGELLTGIYGYLGFIVIGNSDNGIRFATANADGDLTIGALIETAPNPGAGNAVRAFEGQGRFVWFGLNQYQGSASGLGRIDLQNFSDVENLVPAYASDLMAEGESGRIDSIVTFNNRRVFVVNGDGVWAEETDTYVSSGTIDCGLVTYDLYDQKIAHFLDVRFQGSTVNGTIAASLAPSSGTFASVGSHTGAGSTDEFTISGGGTQSEVFETRLALTRGSTTTRPLVTRWTLKSSVIADAGLYIYLPILLSGTENLGYPEHRDLATEIATLKGLRSTRTAIDYQEGGTTYSVILEDYEWRGRKPSKDPSHGGAFNGTFLCKLKVVS